jgi:hypothetical protein
MRRLQLQCEHKPVEPFEEAALVGDVHVEQGEGRGVLLTPEPYDPNLQYPLFTIFHGAGRQDELLAKASRGQPNERQAFFFIPRSIAPTWDLIVDGPAVDVEFLEFAWDLIYRRYAIDPAQRCLIGYSDGASYALSMALSNPGYFAAAMVWAAGFVLLDRNGYDQQGQKARLYLEYGTHDQLFSFEEIALPMRDNLERAGHDVTFSVDEGGRHMPSGSFQREALDWYFEGARK